MENESIIDVILKILSENGIEEDPLSALFEEKTPLSSSTLRLSNNLVRGVLKEIDLTRSVQEQLNVSQLLAEKISNAIIERVIPLLKKELLVPIPLAQVEDLATAIPKRETASQKSTKNKTSTIPSPLNDDKQSPKKPQVLDKYREQL